MRILLCGSGDFGVPTLSAILAAGHEVAALVTQPARPAGRGGHLRHTPLSQAAAAAGLRVLEIERINKPESVATLREVKPDVIVVVAFGQMVRQQVRELAPLGAFNLHASLLPELRGAAPINWALICGYKTTGVTTFSLVDALDAGPMYVRASTDIGAEETLEELKPRLAAIGAKAVCDTLEMLASGKASPVPQDDSAATLAPILKKSDGRFDWSVPAQSIVNLVRGTCPWPGAQAVFEHADTGKQVQVEIAKAAVASEKHVSEDGSPPQRVSDTVSESAEITPGTVTEDLTIATGQGKLQIVRLQPAGKRVMEWRDFVNGYRVRAGDRFVPVV